MLSINRVLGVGLAVLSPNTVSVPLGSKQCNVSVQSRQKYVVETTTKGQDSSHPSNPSSPETGTGCSTCG